MQCVYLHIFIIVADTSCMNAEAENLCIAYSIVQGTIKSRLPCIEIR